MGSLLRRDLQAARDVHRLLTRQGGPRPTYADLWVALAENGVTEGIPLKDLNDPVEVTKCFYSDLAASVSAEYELWQTVSRLHEEVLEALEGYEGPPSEPPGETSRNKFKQVSTIVPDQPCEQPLGPEDVEAVTLAAKEGIEDTLARVFLRLGPPPEPSRPTDTWAGTGGGGAQQ